MNCILQLRLNRERFDLRQIKLEADEFPISKMSMSLASAIAALDRSGRRRLALDVGTGTGVHAFITHNLKFQTVLAIDRNGKAIDHALRRAETFGISSSTVNSSQLHTAVPSSPHSLLFSVCAQEQIAASLQMPGSFDLISFNPPGFFHAEDAQLESPLASGVYSSVDTDCRVVAHSPIYRFFEDVVLPLLAPGGDVVMTWPALEKRVVELEGASGSRECSHPITHLQRWFGLDIVSDQPDAAEFYRETSSISGDYGLGSTFKDRFLADLAKSECYSSLVHASDSDLGGSPSFRFGILHLRRSFENPNRFNLMPSGRDNA